MLLCSLKPKHGHVNGTRYRFESVTNILNEVLQDVTKKNGLYFLWYHPILARTTFPSQDLKELSFPSVYALRFLQKA